MALDQTPNRTARYRTVRSLLWPTARRTWYAWLIFACVVAIIAAQAPDFRTVTHNYRDACHKWFDGRPIYAEGVHGFLYFPQAAILFAPFAYLPASAGEALWRLASIGIFAVAVWRLSVPSCHARLPGALFSRLSLRERTSFCGAKGDNVDFNLAFAMMTFVAIPPSVASARNGQMNLMLTALTALAFVDLGQQRWRIAAFWLCLGAAFKPLMIVPMALAAIVYRPVIRPMMFGMILLLLAPFLTQHPGYVGRQYDICLQKLLLAGNPGLENPASDLFGLVLALGYSAPLALQTATRVLAGGLTVIMALCAVRRHGSARAAQSALALTACYLALFNPRMENNGFVVLAPTLGVLAADAFLNRRHVVVGLLIVVVSLGISCTYEITGGHNFWLCPLLTLIVWGYAIVDAFGPQYVTTTSGSYRSRPAPAPVE
jgi:alpha-1,2-mannosyltransferase